MKFIPARFTLTSDEKELLDSAYNLLEDCLESLMDAEGENFSYLYDTIENAKQYLYMIFATPNIKVEDE